jgi:uncharacterized membrane protein YphA (DoxX/SURF4 family)
MMEKKRALAIGGWIVVWLMTAMLVFAFGAQGVAKFSDTSGWVAAFAHWGYPVWFRMLIGVLEIAAAALLLWPRTAPIGAMIVIVIMIGGIGTHVAAHERHFMRSETGQIVFASVVLWARRANWRPNSQRHSIQAAAGIQ